MRILKQLTRKKNAFFRGIKFNLINYRYRNKPARKAFDPAAVRRVLLLRLDDKVGDMVVTTGCARILAERGYQVSVLTGPICSEILAGSEFIQQVYLYRPRMSLNTLRAAGFDAVIDFDDVTSYERFKLLADLRATSVIGFNKEPYKLYDHSIAFFDGNSHISLRYKQVVKLFGIVDDRPYHYHLPAAAMSGRKWPACFLRPERSNCVSPLTLLPPPRIKTSVVTRWRPWSSGYMLCLTGSVS